MKYTFDADKTLEFSMTTKTYCFRDEAGSPCYFAKIVKGFGDYQVKMYANGEDAAQSQMRVVRKNSIFSTKYEFYEKDGKLAMVVKAGYLGRLILQYDDGVALTGRVNGMFFGQNDRKFKIEETGEIVLKTKLTGTNRFECESFANSKAISINEQQMCAVCAISMIMLLIKRAQVAAQQASR